VEWTVVIATTCCRDQPMLNLANMELDGCPCKFGSAGLYRHSVYRIFVASIKAYPGVWNIKFPCSYTIANELMGFLVHTNYGWTIDKTGYYIVNRVECPAV